MTYISIVAKTINENSNCTCKFLSSNFVSKYGSNPKSNMLNIQSFPQNYQQLALPHVLISLELHANTVMKLNLPYQSYF